MSDKQRAAWERDLQAALEKLGAKQRRELLQALGEPPKLENLPPMFWEEQAKDIYAEIAPELERIYMESAQAMLEGNPAIGVDWALVNRRAADFARQYGFDLVKGITDKTRAVLQGKVSAFYEQAWGLPQLREALEPLYGPVRAEMIAVTEATRAAVQGQQGLVDELNRDGIRLLPTWTTAEDERVCNVCSPRDGKRQGDGWSTPPPAHPRCRCDIAYTFEGA